jgi:hypothetical protein
MQVKTLDWVLFTTRQPKILKTISAHTKNTDNKAFKNIHLVTQSISGQASIVHYEMR